MEGSYKIAKQVHEMVMNVASLEEATACIEEIGNTAEYYKNKYDALVSSISNSPLDKIAKHNLMVNADEILTQYMYEGIDEDTRYILKEYGYNKPAILLDDMEEVSDYLDEGFGVLLLNRDNTEILSYRPLEIEAHLEGGGLVALRPHDYEIAGEMCIEDGLNIDEE